MKINEVLKSPHLLKENFENLIKDLDPTSPVSDSLLKKIKGMPTTHSFGYKKTFKVEGLPKANETVYPYRQILFQEKALLSDANRTKNKKFKPSESKRTMTKARAYGLEEYIFTYLGAHEYYYSQTKGMNTPAFGIFLSHDLEKIKTWSNATHYDLESPRAEFYTPQEITLSPNEARIVTAYETERIYKGDFFNYWICEDYKAKKFHDDKMWDQKREFHYKDVIAVNEIEAIIWPIRTVYNDKRKTSTLDNSMIEDIFEFKQLNPHIMIYPYVWVANKGIDRFSLASFLVSECYYEKGNLLDESAFLVEFQKEYPKPTF